MQVVVARDPRDADSARTLLVAGGACYVGETGRGWMRSSETAGGRSQCFKQVTAGE